MSIKSRHTGRNNLVYLLPDFPFDYCYLMWVLRSYRSPRDKISRMLRNGEIIRIKKGLYIRSPGYGGKADKKVIANLIYGPSYISLDFALQYRGLIPERVELVTSITSKRNKIFHTPLGSFSYKYLHHSKFHPGVLLEKTELSGQRGNRENKTGFFIASEEKALCDKLATVRDIDKPEDIPEYLESDLRIDTDLLRLDIRQLYKIEKVYKKKSVTAFVRWYKAHMGA
ncbi:hypothetical protein QUF80_22545 [Desulfococcaceae bacterium HSG8]|nr:hypothetical protein [Desulfococcaceae bacterium HSG8]